MTDEEVVVLAGMMNVTEPSLRELMKTPECRAEFARIQAKTAIHQDGLVAQAIRDAVRQEREDVDAFLAARVAPCKCLTDGYAPCMACAEMVHIRAALKERPER